MKSLIPWYTIGLVVAWYSSNIGVLLLNKYLLTNYGFKYPVFLTMCHMSMCSVLSYVAIACMKAVPLQHIASKTQFVKIARLAQCRFLLLRGLWECVVEVYSGVV